MRGQYEIWITKLKNERERLNLSQKEVAKNLGVSRVYYADLERGAKRVKNIEMLIDWFALYGLELIPVHSYWLLKDQVDSGNKFSLKPQNVTTKPPK